jgi:hypothetical protein
MGAPLPDESEARATATGYEDGQMATRSLQACELCFWAIRKELVVDAAAGGVARHGTAGEGWSRGLARLERAGRPTREPDDIDFVRNLLGGTAAPGDPRAAR